MSIMPDSWIIDKSKNHCMIDPFCENLVSEKNNKKIISYGVSSYGYDVRLFNQFQLFSTNNNYLIDPKNFNKNILEDLEGDYCIIPPNTCLLGRTVEYFKIPRDILVVCLTKSTYARCGLIANVTPIEPEFEGHVVLELSNTTPIPIKVYSNEGICQFLFFKSNINCSVSYADRRGKYMNQVGITLPIV